MSRFEIDGTGSESGQGVFEKKSEFFERLRQLLHGVGGVVEFTGADEKVFYPGSAQIMGKNTVGIVKITDDLLVTGKKSRKLGIQGCIFAKTTGERSVFDGMDGISVTRIEAEAGDTWIAENLDAGGGKIFPDETQGGQSEYEIADGTAANDQNASGHKSVQAGELVVFFVATNGIETACITFPALGLVPGDGAHGFAKCGSLLGGRCLGAGTGRERCDGTSEDEDLGDSGEHEINCRRK